MDAENWSGKFDKPFGAIFAFRVNFLRNVKLATLTQGEECIAIFPSSSPVFNNHHCQKCLPYTKWKSCLATSDKLISLILTSEGSGTNLWISLCHSAHGTVLSGQCFILDGSGERIDRKERGKIRLRSPESTIRRWDKGNPGKAAGEQTFYHPVLLHISPPPTLSLT